MLDGCTLLLCATSVLLALAADCPEGLDRISVQIPWFSQPQFAGWEVPNSGTSGAPTYADECLRVQVRPGGPDFDAIEELMSGRADLAISEGIYIAQAIAAGANLTIIANFFQRPALMLASVDKYPNIQALEGKRVGVWCCGYDVPIKMMFQKAGVSVTYVDQGFSLTQLYAGDVDLASVMVYNELALLMEDLDHNINYLRQRSNIWELSPSLLSVPHVHCPVIVKTERLPELADKLVRVLRVVSRAWVFCRDNELACVKSYVNSGAHFQWQMREINKLIFPSPGGLGVLPVERWDELDAFLVQQGMFASRVGHSFVDNSLIQRAIAEDSTMAAKDPLRAGVQDTLDICAPYGSNYFVACHTSWFQHTLCNVGEYAVGPEDENCTQCAAGRFSYNLDAQVDGSRHPLSCSPTCPARMLQCRTCLAGTFQAAPGESQCSFCERGRFRDNAISAVVCQECPAGTYATTLGQTSCVQCTPGFYSSGTGATECVACPVGSFQPWGGQSSCRVCGTTMNQTEVGGDLHLIDVESLETTKAIASVAMDQCVCANGAYSTPAGCMRCPSGSMTLLDGSTNVGSCLCQRGDYMPYLPSGCKGCPEGMYCPMGSNEANALYINLESPTKEQQFLELLPSYWSSLARPMKLFLCAKPAFCPGGKPGHCAEHRDPSTIGCADCLPNMYEGIDGRCVPCEEGQVATLVVVGVGAAVLVCCLLVWLANKNILAQRNSNTSCAIIIGHMIGGAQTLGVFSSLTVRWVDPLKNLVQIASLFTLDLKVLMAGCLVGSGPIEILVLRQLLAPGFACIILIILALKKTLRDRSLHYWVESVNTVGTIYLIFFVSIVSSAVQPFVCYAHPDNNGFSMVASPGVLCFEDPRHASMELVGILALLLTILPFLAIVIWAIVRYRTLVTRGCADAHLRSFRFLLFKYNPHHYYFAIITLFRGLVLCLMPVVARKSPAAQIIGMAALLIVYCNLQMNIKPWRGIITNVADGVLTGCLLLLLICAAVGTTFEQADTVIGTFGAVVLVLFFCVVFGIIATVLYRRFVPRPYYSRFICHHKADAAAQARLLQITLSERTHTTVFIDSDHLNNLDALFDIVRCRTGCLVIYLTRDTLKRPWCAGEISVAFSTHKRVITVKTPAYVAPAIADLEENKIATFLADGPDLAEYGVVNGVISLALSWVTSADVPSVSVDADGVGQLRFQSLVNKLVSTPHRNNEVAQHDFQRTVVISSLRGYDEATAAVGILMSKIKNDVLEFATHGIAALCDFPAPEQAEDKERIRSVVTKSTAVVVLLSSGSLESEEQLNVIALALNVRSLPALPMAMPCFRFPSPDFFTQELPKRAPCDIIGHLQVLFKQIAVAFPINESTAILNTQAAAVVCRLKADCKRVSATTPDTTVTSQSVCNWRPIPYNRTADAAVGITVRTCC